MNWYVEVLKKYAEFSGRARRSEYWMFFLINLLITIGLTIIDNVTGLYNKQAGVGVLSSLYGLAVLIPGIAVAVRRLHDTGRSGWWLLISFVPCVGLIIIYFLVVDSQPGSNEYGPNPKRLELAEE